MLKKELINKIYGYSLTVILVLIIVELISLTLVCLWGSWTMVTFMKIFITNILLFLPTFGASAFYHCT